MRCFGGAITTLCKHIKPCLYSKCFFAFDFKRLTFFSLLQQYLDVNKKTKNFKKALDFNAHYAYNINCKEDKKCDTGK